MSKKVEFKSEIALGHVVQALIAIAGIIGLYYTLVSDVRMNSADIATNRAYIQEIKKDLKNTANSIQKIKDELRTEMQLQEQRQLQHIIETKDDVRWLVRRTKGDANVD